MNDGEEPRFIPSVNIRLPYWLEVAHAAGSEHEKKTMLRMKSRYGQWVQRLWPEFVLASQMQLDLSEWDRARSAADEILSMVSVLDAQRVAKLAEVLGKMENIGEAHAISGKHRDMDLAVVQAAHLHLCLKRPEGYGRKCLVEGDFGPFRMWFPTQQGLLRYIGEQRGKVDAANLSKCVRKLDLPIAD